MTPSSPEAKRHLARRIAALGDPLRMALLDTLAVRPAGATELAEELGQAVAKVRYHLGRLAVNDLVVVVERRPRRGTLERIFDADPRQAAAHEEALLAAAPDSRRLLQAPLVRTIFGGLLGALQTGAFDSFDDHVIGRVPLSLDEHGHREVEVILKEASERLFAIRDESRQRLATTGLPAVAAISALLHLELTG